MFQLTAPNAICGRVIGRGGSKINSITVRDLIHQKIIVFSSLWQNIIANNYLVCVILLLCIRFE